MTKNTILLCLVVLAFFESSCSHEDNKYYKCDSYVWENSQNSASEAITVLPSHFLKVCSPGEKACSGKNDAYFDAGYYFSQDICERVFQSMQSQTTGLFGHCVPIESVSKSVRFKHAAKCKPVERTEIFANE